ncbi:zinc finger CCCH domain-containing protein 14 [Chrysoperla carnea]|uniref:zinc finger CCCH domain-containing protein 14 n=1 Tax=Chrysoperla carnea TaxID=189513 RepID=UPI001D098DDE|nr:zinc finger CCCH domain-containing protein 14 [Chrysoperla carnea]
MDKITEVGHKMRSAIKAKLIELGCYVDDELPDYIMVMVANHRSKEMMLEDLQLFLDSNTQIFVNWLHHVLQKLHEVTVSSIDIPKITKQEARLKRKIVESKKNKTNESLIDDELKNSTKHEVKIKTLKTENKTTPSLTDDLPISAKTIVERQRRISLKTKEQEPEKETIVSDNNQLELAEIENKILEAKNKLAELEKNDNDKNVIDDDEFINIAAHDDELQFDDDKDDGCLTPPLLEHHQSSLKMNKTSEKKVSILDRLGEKKQHKPITSVASSSSEKKIRLSEIKKIENELLYGSSKSKEMHSSSSQINSKRDLKRKSNVHERIGIMSSIVKPISSNSNKRRREQHTDDDDVDKDADTTTTISSVIKITPRNSKLTKNKIQPNSNLLLKAMADAHKSINISNINNNNNNKPTTNSTTTSTAIITSSDRKNINNKRTLNDTSNENKSKKKELYTSHYNKNKKDIKTDTNKKLIQNIIIKVNTATSNVTDNNSDHSKQEDDHDKHINKDVQDEEEEVEEEAEEDEQLILPTSTTNDHVQHEKSEPKQRFIVTLNGVDENKIFKKSLKTKIKKAESDNDKLLTTTNDNDNDNDIKEEEYIKRVKISNDDIDDKKIEKKKKRAPSPITFNESDFNTKTNSSSVSTTAIGTATTILKKQNKNDEQREHKCKYWPRCKLKDGHCDGRHEPPATLPPVVVNTSQQRCKTFPLCKYGQHCYYLHPLCKYNLQCTSLNCIYKHTNRSAIQTQIPPSIASTVVAVPVPVTVPIPVANKICKYYPKCTNVQCKYIHKKPTSLPIPCRYGQYCLNQYECNYDHSIISSSSSRIINFSSSSMISNKYKLKWKSTL